MNLIINKKEKGFVILFALMLSSIILAISLGISNVALKEIAFSTSAQGTNDAFFASDTGLECALYHDRTDVNAFPISGAPLAVSCASGVVSGSGNGTIANYNFIITGLGNQGQSCAKVTVEKDNTTPPMLTTITSKGYNMGDGSCNSSSLRRIERELEATY